MELPDPPPVRPPDRRGRFGFLAAGVGLVAALVGVGLLPRLEHQKHLAAATDDHGPPSVNVVRPRRARTASALTLPGSAQALKETVIYARVGGYLSLRTVDIGDRVRAGQILARIEAPETRQQLIQAQAREAQARADLVQATAELNRAATTYGRWQQLNREGAVSVQDAEQRRAAYESQKALVAARRSAATTAAAEVRRLAALLAFTEVRAPFDGVITACALDDGALIAGGANRTSLFRVAQTERLRIFVNVPQTYAATIAVGQPAEVSVTERPEQVFAGRVTRTAGALDPGARTLLTEVQVDNREGRLLPGMFTQVRLVGRLSTPPLLVPATALVVRDGTPQVAVIDSRGVVHFRKLALGRDDGSEVEVLAGLSGSESLVSHPTDDLREGEPVHAIN